MKKALIVLLILAVAGGLFAQQLSWTGHLGTGVFINLGDDFDDPIAYVDDDDEGVPAFAKLLGAYDAGDWGVNIGFKAAVGDLSGVGDAGVLAAFAAQAYDAHGWLKFADGLLTLRAGLIDPGVWYLGDNWVDDNPGTNLSSGPGVRAEITPMDGLNVGVRLGFPGLIAGVVDDGVGFGLDGKPTKLSDFFKSTVIGFSYDPGAFKLAAAIKLRAEAGVDPYTQGDDSSDAILTAGFGITPMDNLDVLISARIDHLLGSADADPKIWLGQNIDFKLSDQLGVGIELGEVLSDGLKWFHARPFVTFGVSEAVSVGAEIPVNMEDVGNDLGLANLGANLWAKYTIGGGWVKFGYGFQKVSKDYGKGIDQSSDFSGDSLNHGIKIICGFDF